jgi:hypothetical protein
LSLDVYENNTCFEKIATDGMEKPQNMAELSTNYVTFTKFH